MGKPNLRLVQPEPPGNGPHGDHVGGFAEGAYIAPEVLHTVLRKAASQLVTFHSEKALRYYRHKLYAINRDGIRRYRTIRDEDHMYGILILRLK